MRSFDLTSQSVTGFLRSLGHARCHTTSETHSSLSIRGATIFRVLIVEVRDEVFACLSSLFQDHGVLVARAESSTALAERAASFRADLVLINADQPDENGWLTCARLRLQEQGQRLWVYAAHKPVLLEQWVGLSGADETILYGGVLATLVAGVRKRTVATQSRDAPAIAAVLPMAIV
tara:strand:+ start:18980 stop:19510 length:531 start_codon:yes stop_codon:yes gene_type:complete